jgi:hypothetical protein
LQISRLWLVSSELSLKEGTGQSIAACLLRI